MTVLITGATGFLGGALARRLLSEGVPVRAYVRNADKAAGLRERGAEIVVGDVTDRDRTRYAARDCELIFHIAAALSGNFEAQRIVNVDGTRAVMLAAADAGVARIVHVSSMAVYGYREQRPLSENIPRAPGADAYAVTKSQGEGVVREVGGSHGVPFTIIRPGAIYGAGAGLWTRTFFRLATARFTPWLGDGSGFAPYIHIEDVVDQMIALSRHPAAINEAFNSTNDPAPTYRGILEAYARLAGKPVHWVSLPDATFQIVGGLARVFAPRHSQLRDLPDLVGYVKRRSGFPMGKTRQAIGWEPRIGLDEGVARCADWLRAEGLL